jgi:fructose-1,6-bisphosphatase I
MLDRALITTVERHLLEAKGQNPHATEEFSWLLSGITLATKTIAAQIQRAGLLDIIGRTGQVNVQGEEVQKLDIFANEVLVRCLGYRGTIGILVSEEDEDPHVIQEAQSGKYIVLFDPLDGSSNINANVSIGTIFSILARDPGGSGSDVMSHILQPGYKQVAAGYVVYGSSTVLAYTVGNGVHMFTLDPSIGAFLLAEEHVRMPEAGRIYSVNVDSWGRISLSRHQEVAGRQTAPALRSQSARFRGRAGRRRRDGRQAAGARQTTKGNARANTPHHRQQR